MMLMMWQNIPGYSISIGVSFDLGKLLCGGCFELSLGAGIVTTYSDQPTRTKMGQDLLGCMLSMQAMRTGVDIDPGSCPSPLALTLWP